MYSGDNNFLELDHITTIEQKIHAMIKVSSMNNSWLFNKRQILRQNLHTIKDTYKGKWLIGGDFHKLLHNVEKK